MTSWWLDWDGFIDGSLTNGRINTFKGAAQLFPHISSAVISCKTFLFTLSVTHQDAKCMSSRYYKHVESISFLKNHFHACLLASCLLPSPFCWHRSVFLDILPPPVDQCLQYLTGQWSLLLFQMNYSCIKQASMYYVFVVWQTHLKQTWRSETCWSEQQLCFF